MRRFIMVVTLITLVAVAEDPMLKISDPKSFFIRKLGLSYEEASMKAQDLYKKGMRLFTKADKKRSAQLMQTRFSYKEASKKKEAMRYLIASGLLGNRDAALIAIHYLTVDTFLPGSLQYRALLAKSLHDHGYLYGTYLLAWGYLNGRGVSKSVDMAKLHFEKVVSACQKDEKRAALSLVDDTKVGQRALKAAKRRCRIAAMLYRQLQKDSLSQTYDVKIDSSFKTKVRKILQKKADKSIKHAYGR